jgi:hypothetical protein
VAFWRLLAGSVLREFDQHQVMYILTKSKSSIEYKPVSKCSTGPDTFRKAIVDKKIHILRAVRVFLCLAVSKFLWCTDSYQLQQDSYLCFCLRKAGLGVRHANPVVLHVSVVQSVRLKTELDGRDTRISYNPPLTSDSAGSWSRQSRALFSFVLTKSRVQVSVVIPALPLLLPISFLSTPTQIPGY